MGSKVYDFHDLPSAKATEIVRQRQGQYGHPGPIYETVAEFWNTWLGSRLIEPIKPEDVAMMMALLKQGRERHRHNDDNIDDLAGYANVYDMVRAYFERED